MNPATQNRLKNLQEQKAVIHKEAKAIREKQSAIPEPEPETMEDQVLRHKRFTNASDAYIRPIESHELMQSNQQLSDVLRRSLDVDKTIANLGEQVMVDELSDIISRYSRLAVEVSQLFAEIAVRLHFDRGSYAYFSMNPPEFMVCAHKEFDPMRDLNIRQLMTETSLAVQQRIKAINDEVSEANVIRHI